MNILILCKTNPKDSYQTDGLKFHKKYSIGYNLTDAEKYNFHENYHMDNIYRWHNPVVTMRRRVDVIGNITTPWEWEYFDIFKNSVDASFGFGDSDYWDGVSTHLLHKKAVEHIKEQDELNSQLKNLEEQKVELKVKYNGLYDDELKSRRLYHKAKNGKAPQNVIDEIQVRLRIEYENELDKLREKINEIQEKLMP